ncbi:uncharacterized protein LOC126737076 [Anthonomus grandis grandis]|uniref:uncharacterized protein LOC126737076 n=1 Tax=Anthonomus grandis grandis TaxID=2921223 RepID=UPI002165D8F3|nr:uncharacterized protein LOC126737076 [Anthonomus grandis grandis]
MPRGITLALCIKQLIISKYQSGVKQAIIAKQLGLNRSVVSKTIKLHHIRNSLISPPKTGRPRKTTPRVDEKIKSIALENPFNTAMDIKSQLDDVNISIHTVRRRLRDSGLPARTPSKKPFISKKNRTARVQFAHGQKQDGIQYYFRMKETLISSNNHILTSSV